MPNSESNNQHLAPSPDEIEVSVFGRGFGESIVFHIGDGKWGVVDSFINGETKLPRALEYLEGLGVNIAKDLLLIVATHWDNDHILGLSELLSRATNSIVVFSAAMQSEEVRTLAQIYKTREIDDGGGLSEYSKILDILQTRVERGGIGSPTWATEGLELLHGHILKDGTSVKIRSLSPSNAAFSATQAWLQSNFERVRKKRSAVPKLQPNDCSVVLSIEIGQYSILLGGDLEEGKGKSLGWSAVVKFLGHFSIQYDIFKVPHHGSTNGYSERVWTNLLKNDPEVCITPWIQGGRSLPNKEGLDLIRKHTKKGYITCDTRLRRSRHSNPTVSRSMRDPQTNIRRLSQKGGQIRLRLDRTKAKPVWSCSLFGEALSIEDFYKSLSNN